MEVDHIGIVNLTKGSDEWDTIETNVLDKSNMLNRVLLPLYVVYEQLDNAHGLTSGDTAKVTRELGVPVSQPNASRTLSGSAKKFVVADKTRVRGIPVRYKLSRAGHKHMQQALGKTRSGS